MPTECPKCGRMNPEDAHRCSCGQDLAEEAEQPDTAPQTVRPMEAADDLLPRRCPLCQGTNVRTDGWASVETRIQFGRKWIGPFNTGYGLYCFACLSCGFVGHYVTPGDLQRLQSQPVTTLPARRRSGCMGVLLLFVLGVGLCAMAGCLVAGAG